MLTKREREVAKLFTEALHGDMKAVNQFIEGISTSDIPATIAPTLQGIMLNEYEGRTRIWGAWAGKEYVNSFEEHNFYRMAFDGDTDTPKKTAGKNYVSGGLPHIPEYGEYPVIRLEASEQKLKTAKSGQQAKVSWETVILTRNIDLVTKMFKFFGLNAAREEDIQATKPIFGATGLNATNFKSANGNILTGNPVLSRQSLEDAFAAISVQTSNGNRIEVPSSYALVIPPALETVAKDIQGATKITRTSTVGSETVVTETANSLGSKFSIVVNPHIPNIANTNGDTSWALIPAPGATANPSVVNVFLRGYDTPQLFTKVTALNTNEAFVDDSVSYKIRHVVSGGFIDPAGTIGSNGSGS